jgi:hypothetical protein
VKAEQPGQDYLFRLRLTKTVKRAIERAMGEQDSPDAGAPMAGQGWPATSSGMEQAPPHRDSAASP